ncbi:MAG: hypothetical protein HY301_13225 [Verrucomicrobia bacterium]|nr:hypothetical protein [Verrucomicrobiota bacterium]
MPEIQQTFTDASVTQAEWEWVKDLIEDVKKDSQRDAFAQRLFQWDLAVKQFRKVELKRVLQDRPSEMDLDRHAVCLHALLAIGFSLRAQSKTFTPENLTALGVDHQQIAAYVIELEQSLREWHHGFSETELKQAQEKIFGAAA